VKALAEPTPVTASPSRGPVQTPVLFGLAAVTGLVDAVCYLALGHVFTANMTGNVVLLGCAVAGGESLSVSRSMNATVRELGEREVNTTVLTLTLTGIAADSVFAGANDRGVLRRVGFVMSVMAGAAVGALLLRHSAALPLVIGGTASTCAPLLCIGIVTRTREPRRRSSMLA